MAKRRKNEIDDDNDDSEDDFEEVRDEESQTQEAIEGPKIETGSGEFMVVGEGQFLDNKEVPDGTLLNIDEDTAKALMAAGLKLKKVTGDWSPPTPSEK